MIVPPELSAEEAELYSAAAENLLSAYGQLHERALSYLHEQFPQPTEMKAEPCRRNLAARAFDVARYLLPF